MGRFAVKKALFVEAICAFNSAFTLSTNGSLLLDSMSSRDDGQQPQPLPSRHLDWLHSQAADASLCRDAQACQRYPSADKSASAAQPPRPFGRPELSMFKRGSDRLRQA